MRKIILALLSAAVIYGLAPATVYFSTSNQAEARGGNRAGGGGARHTVNRPGGYGGGTQNKVIDNTNIKNTNISNNNVNVNVNRNTNINVHNGYYDRNYYHPVATAAAITATAIAVGTIVAALPSGCSQVIVNGIAYQQCGSVWYAPQYQGTTVNYIVVNPPR